MTKWQMVPLGEVVTQDKTSTSVQADREYPNFGIYSFGRGLFAKSPISGATTSANSLYRVRAGQFIYSRLFAFEGAYGLVGEEFDGWFISNEYPHFDCDPKRLSPAFLAAYFKWKKVWEQAAMLSTGMGDRRRRIQPEQLLKLLIPLPPLREQQRIVEHLDALYVKVDEAKKLRNVANRETELLCQAHTLQLFEELCSRYDLANLGAFESHVTSGPRSWGQRTSDKGERFYRAQDVLPRGRLAETGKVFITPPDSNQGAGARLQAGDLMIVITGATVGRVAVFPTNAEPGYVSQHVAICRIVSDKLHPQFALHGLLSPFGQKQLLGQRYGQGKPGLNLTNIRNLQLPLPPIPVQQQTIQYIDQFQTMLIRLSEVRVSVESELTAAMPSVFSSVFGYDHCIGISPTA